MDSEKFKNWALGAMGIGVVITFLLATFAYLGPIRFNTEFIRSISESTIRIEENTKLIPSIKEDTTNLRARAEAFITPQKGGKLRVLDRYAIFNIKPKTVSEEIMLQYMPLTIRELPAEFPKGIESVGYNFALTPYTLNGVQLPDLFFKEPAEMSVAYTNLDLDLTTNKLIDLILQIWDGKEGKWVPLKTTIKGKILYAHITQSGYFALTFHSSEKISS